MIEYMTYRCTETLGDDAHQAVTLSFLEVVKGYDTTTKTRLVALQVRQDTWEPFRSLLRRQAAREGLAAVLDEEKIEAREERNALRIVLQLVEQAGDRISERDKTILSLHLEGYTGPEIAEIVGENKEVVKKVLQALPDRLAGKARQKAHGQKPRR